MTPILVGLAHTGVLIALAAALVSPRLRRPVARAVLALGALALATGILAGGPRTLEIQAAIASFRDNAVVLADHPVETVTAPAWAFGLVALAFGALWFVVLGALDRSTRSEAGRPPPPGAGARPFAHPMLLAWSGIALVLAFEKTAAPAALVQPVGFERAILPAAVAAATLFAIRLRSFLWSFIWLSLFVSVARWPIAAFGTWATQGRHGTSLDVHSIENFANPFAQQPLRVVPHSTEQLAWLLWGPNLLILPALYLLSTGGIAFAVAMFVLHPPESSDQRAAGTR